MDDLLRYRFKRYLLISFISAVISAMITPFFPDFMAFPIINGFIIGFFSPLLHLFFQDYAIERITRSVPVWQIFID